LDDWINEGINHSRLRRRRGEEEEREGEKDVHTLNHTHP
jgi:hypothetical protein